MKIYAASTWNELKKFAGTEYWVLCDFYTGIFSETPSQLYIRVLSMDNNLLEYNSIGKRRAETILEHPSEYSYYVINSWLGGTNRADCDDIGSEIKISRPIKTIKTEQFYSGYKYLANSKLFDSICGKDIWVRATNTSESGNKYYIRILSKSRNIITYNRINAAPLDNPNSNAKFEVYGKYGVNYVWKSHIDKWMVDEPREMLTSEEILDFMHDAGIDDIVL